MDSKLKEISQSMSSYIETRSSKDIGAITGNLYESIVVMSRRSSQISKDLKEELHDKLQEFAIPGETLEEIQENREQIEISRYYERLPHSTLLATEEFIAGETYYRRKGEE